MITQPSITVPVPSQLPTSTLPAFLCIPTEQAQAILNFLQVQPYNQVAALIGAMLDAPGLQIDNIALEQVGQQKRIVLAPAPTVDAKPELVVAEPAPTE